MPIVRAGFDHVPYIGVYALGTDRMAFLPAGFHVREGAVRDALGVPVGRVRVQRSPLLGLFATGNSNGIICPDLLEPEEEEKFVELGVKITRIVGGYTAFGNLILANDRGALVSPTLPGETLKLISEGLGIRVERGTIAGIKNVGAAGVATDRGALVHPDASAEELERISRILKVSVEVGTVCKGVKYIGLCMVANSNGAVVGSPTTGPELGRVEGALGFI